eukprot:3620570-Amphidinium_carterae.1
MRCSTCAEQILQSIAVAKCCPGCNAVACKTGHYQYMHTQLSQYHVYVAHTISSGITPCTAAMLPSALRFALPSASGVSQRLRYKLVLQTWEHLRRLYKIAWFECGAGAFRSKVPGGTATC